MNNLTTPPVPTINSAIVERWNRIPPDHPIDVRLTRQEYDTILSALLDMQNALSSLGRAISSPGRQPDQPVDWAEFINYLNLTSSTHIRVARFIETIMVKASNP